MCLFPLCLLNRLKFDLDFYMRMGHDHRSHGIEIEGHRFGLKVKVNVRAIQLRHSEH